MRRTMYAAALGLALVLGGCSASDERRVDRAWDELRGAPSDRVELNTASRREIARLPGLNDDDAKRIVANRPYPNKRALLDKGVIGERKFEEIRDYVYVSERTRDRDRRDDD